MNVCQISYFLEHVELSKQDAHGRGTVSSLDHGPGSQLGVCPSTSFSKWSFKTKEPQVQGLRAQKWGRKGGRENGGEREHEKMKNAKEGGEKGDKRVGTETRMQNDSGNHGRIRVGRVGGRGLCGCKGAVEQPLGTLLKVPSSVAPCKAAAGAPALRALWRPSAEVGSHVCPTPASTRLIHTIALPSPRAAAQPVGVRKWRNKRHRLSPPNTHPLN